MNAPSPSVTVSDAAIKRIAAILSADPAKSALRISVEGGGCSGFSYKYDLVDEPAGDDDLVIERQGARIYLDAVSLMYMGGSQVDFVDDLMGRNFQIKNPNAAAAAPALRFRISFKPASSFKS